MNIVDPKHKCQEVTSLATELETLMASCDGSIDCANLANNKNASETLKNADPAMIARAARSLGYRVYE